MGFRDARVQAKLIFERISDRWGSQAKICMNFLSRRKREWGCWKNADDMAFRCFLQMRLFFWGEAPQKKSTTGRSSKSIGRRDSPLVFVVVVVVFGVVVVVVAELF